MAERRDTSANRLISQLYDIYDWKYFHIGQDLQSESKKTGLFKSETVTVDRKEEVLKRQIEDTTEELRTEVPSFETLWDFCEFVRIAEMVFFYKNVPENRVYVEMKFNDPKDKERRMCVKLDEAEIRLTLEHNILTSDIIRINVIRNFGMRMENKYNVVDGEMEFKDSSDRYLINEINRHICKAMGNLFHSVAMYIVDDTWENTQ